MGHTLVLDGKSLSIDDVVRVASAQPGSVKVELSDSATKAIDRSRAVVDDAVGKKLTIYGLNTGFGSQAENVIPNNEIELLQRYLIVSHSVGVGDPVAPEITRATMLIRANTLSRGNSGIRINVVNTLLDMLNKGVTPYLYDKGSLGASGDLAPLSHIALVLSKDPRAEMQKREDVLASKARKGVKLSETEARAALKESGEALLWQKGAWIKMTGLEAMAKAKVERIVLKAKEGLALNNGANFSAAIACFVTHYGLIVEESADRILALSFEALKGFESAFAPEIHASRGHPGQIEVARRLREYLAGSELISTIERIQNSKNVMKELGKVQDSYSLRAAPQIHGPVLDALRAAQKMLANEINASTDNPLIFPESKYLNKTFSGGNFHGEYISMEMDHVGNAIGILGNVSERRIFKLVTHTLNEGLPPFLISSRHASAGLMNGAMLLQYTAASLASEDKILSHPASSDSITSSEDKEDFVSMAPIAARKAMAILKNVEYILAIELWCDIIALRLRISEGKRPSANARKIMDKLQKYIPELTEDRVTYDEIQQLQNVIHNKELL